MAHELPHLFVVASGLSEKDRVLVDGLRKRPGRQRDRRGEPDAGRGARQPRRAGGMSRCSANSSTGRCSRSSLSVADRVPGRAGDPHASRVAVPRDRAAARASSRIASPAPAPRCSSTRRSSRWSAPSTACRACATSSRTRPSAGEATIQVIFELGHRSEPGGRQRQDPRRPGAQQAAAAGAARRRHRGLRAAQHADVRQPVQRRTRRSTRSSSTTSPTSTSSPSCSASRASARRASSAAASTPCASGSTPTACAPTTSRPRR